MARCNLGYHGQCTSCNDTINPTRDHVHHWTKRNGGTRNVLCDRCCGITFRAASTILKTVEAYNGLTGHNETLESLIDAQRITIGIQDRLL